MNSVRARLDSVRDFMSRHVQTILSSFTVDEAIKKMAEKNVGSLVVMGGDVPKGILSERDLVSKIVAAGRTPKEIFVTDAMSGEIVKFHPSQSLKDAAKTMNSRKNRLLVFEGDRMAGIITATDIVRAIHEMNYTLNISKSLMRSVYQLKAEDSLDQAVQMMSQLRVGSIIITQDGEPDGIFTERDLVRRVLAPHLNLGSSVGGQATRPLITAEDTIDGRTAASIMTRNRIKRLPLTRDEIIVGIVTARDLVEAFANS